LLAVADGVGGWNERGVDPALFSKELCKNLRESYYDHLGNLNNII
jgi:serine/threonine protein phosphatase PrpC